MPEPKGVRINVMCLKPITKIITTEDIEAVLCFDNNVVINLHLREKSRNVEENIPKNVMIIELVELFKLLEKAHPYFEECMLPADMYEATRFLQTFVLYARILTTGSQVLKIELPPPVKALCDLF